MFPLYCTMVASYMVPPRIPALIPYSKNGTSPSHGAHGAFSMLNMYILYLIFFPISFRIHFHGIQHMVITYFLRFCHKFEKNDNWTYSAAERFSLDDYPSSTLSGHYFPAVRSKLYNCFI